MKAIVLGAALACAAIVAMGACGDSSSGGGAKPVEAGLDAPLFGETSAPDAEPEPGPGDPCGDRSGLQQSASWPALGGCPKRAGFADFTGPRNAITKWTVPLSAGATSPVIDASRVVWVGTSDGDVVAVSSVGVAQSATHTGGAIKASATMNVAGAAIVGSTDGFLYGVLRGGAAPSDAGADADADADADTDAGLPPGNVVLQKQIVSITSSAMIAHDGTIYVTAADTLVALAQDGSPKWSTPIGGSTSSPALGGDETIYVGSSDGHLYAVGAIGDVRWAYDAASPISAAPVVGGDGTIYVGSGDGNVHAVDPAGGARKWTYATGGSVNGLATYAGTVFAASADKKLHAVATRTGKAKWTFETLGSVATPLVDKEGMVFFGSTDGKVYVLTPGGSLFFAVNARGPITSAPAISDDGTLYVTTANALVAIGP